MKKILSVLLVLALALSLTSCGLIDSILSKFKKNDSPYVGTWNATGYQVSGMDIGTDMLGEGKLELKSNGKCDLTLAGQTYKGAKWKETETGIEVSQGGTAYTATMNGGTMTLDFGQMLVYLERDGGFAGAQTDSAEPAQTDGTAARAAAAQWNGYWYGSIWVTKTYGDSYSDFQDKFSDFYGYISVDDSGYGSFNADFDRFDVEGGSYSASLSMWIQADADHFEQTGGEAWFQDMDITEDGYGKDFNISAANGNRNAFVIDSRYADPAATDTGYDYRIILIRWGSEWDTGIDEITPPGYDDYLSEIKTSPTKWTMQ